MGSIMKPKTFLLVSESTRARFVRNVVLACVAAIISGSCKDSVAPPDPAADLVWTAVPSIGAKLVGISGTGPANIWAVGDDAILHYDGTTWTIIDTGTGFVTGVWGSSRSDVWFVGLRKNGFASAHPETLFHFNGASFNLVAIGPYDLYGVWGASTSDVWAVGKDADIGQAAVFHFNGIEWFETSIEDNQTLYSVWGTSPSDVWIAGNAPDLLRHYDGNTWSPIAHPSPIRAGWSSEASDVWTVGEGLLHAAP